MIAQILAVIVAIALLMLLSPVTIYANSTRLGGKIDGDFRISWIIFMFRYAIKDRQMEVLAFGRRIIRASHKRKPPKPKKQKKPGKIKRLQGMLLIGDIFNLGRPTLQLFKGFVYAFRLKYLDIDITYGLDDPAYTGILTGFLYAVSGFSRTGHNIRFASDFTRQVLDWNLRVKVSVIPIRIILPLAGFVTNRDVLRSGLRIIRGQFEY
ncbi:Uncharacterised protein [uncultured archaeon]|nr:Uncharacterised protein [uncultured archaeon]